MNTLNRIRNLSDNKKKIIIWSVVAIVGIGLAIFYIKDAQKIIKELNKERIKEDLNLPEINFPKIEMPQFNGEELRALEELKKAEEEKQKTGNLNGGQKSATTTE